MQERGSDLSATELCRREGCPELAEVLERRIDELERVKARLHGTDGDHADDATPVGHRDGTQRSAGQGATVPAPPITVASQTNYRALEFCAKGGMGEVFVAEDEALGRMVALKLIQRGRAGDARSRGRFLREAEITSRLEHPGVVPVYGLGRDGEDRPCYTMRLVKGETLATAIRRFHASDQATRDPGERNLAFRELLGRFVSVCKTIAFAHSRNVLHRDLKPSNIMLGEYGESLVMDWGLAKRLDQDEPDARAEGVPLSERDTAESSRTKTGAAMGSPPYMSPEQAAGRWSEVGPASDIYSLGATLYALLIGRPPIARDGKLAAPAQRIRSADRALTAICTKALARNPADRYASAQELAEDLERFLADEPVQAWREPRLARLARWSRRHRTWAVAGAASLALVTTLAVSSAAVINHWRHIAESERARAKSSLHDARSAVDDLFTQVSENRLLNMPDFEPLRSDLLEAALQYYQHFVLETGDDPVLKLDVAATHLRVAQATVDLERSQEVLYHFGQGVYLLEQLRSKHPDLAQYKSRLAGIHKGRFRRSSPDPSPPQLDEQAVAIGSSLLERAQRIWDGLARDFPEEPGFTSDRAALFHIRGILQLAGRQYQEARDSFQHARQLWEELVAKYPQNSNYRSDLSSTHGNAGMAYYGEGQFDQALREQLDSLAIIRALAADDSAPFFQYDLALAYSTVGLLHEKLQRPQEALAAYSEARAILENVVTNAGYQEIRDTVRRSIARLENTTTQGPSNDRPRLLEP